MPSNRPAADFIRNLTAGLTVSFVAISLGAAFGILSGRGAFAGMLSAGIIATLTAWLGGTRVQCSGPTAPMTAVTAAVVGVAHGRLADSVTGLDPDHFVNLVLILTGALLIAFAALRLGRFIALVPKVVVSGFMNGIAILIWLDQTRKLLGVGGAEPFGGPRAQNVAVAVVTFGLVLILPGLLRRRVPLLARFLPGTLLTILVMTVAAGLAAPGIERVHLDVPMHSLAEVGAFLGAQIPTDWSARVLLTAAPFALQLALLAYLDTLLTSLVVDRLSGEQTRQDRELFGQGVANAAVGFVGGIPGAQATIRSVLILKEGATMRIAGILVGVFVIVELVLFKDLITAIPQAVFAGILFKVGVDVFDWLPVRIYVRELAGERAKLFRNWLDTHSDERIFVTNPEMLFILGTTLVTVFWNLNAAVIGFGALFFLVRRWIPMRDLEPVVETANPLEAAQPDGGYSIGQ